MANERERVPSVDLAVRLVLFLLACGCASIDDVVGASTPLGPSGEASGGLTSPPAWRRRRAAAASPRACAPSKRCRSESRHCRRGARRH